MKNFEQELKELESNYKTKLNALVLQDRFISEIDQLMDDSNLSQKELAEKISVTPSFINQVFKGRKFLNFLNLSKIQEVFNIEFKIQALSKAEIESNNLCYSADVFKLPEYKVGINEIINQTSLDKDFDDIFTQVYKYAGEQNNEEAA